jgi:hypothetical protein
MAANNLRILFNDIAVSSAVSASTSANNFPASNLLLDGKDSAWRSTSAITNTITLNWGSLQSINCVILPFTNFSSAANIKVQLYSSINGTGSLLYDSGTINAFNYSMPSWDTTYTGINAYSYGGGTSVRHYLPSTISNVQSLVLTVVDSGSISGYMEIVRILTGVYWVPKYNLDFGFTVDYIDKSQHNRSQSGNIITDIAPIYKSLTFSLNYMTASDRNYLIQLVKLNGMRKPIFISLFPNDSDAEKEYLYQIYGKLSASPTITHPMYSIYSSNITSEEV